MQVAHVHMAAHLNLPGWCVDACTVYTTIHVYCQGPIVLCWVQPVLGTTALHSSCKEAYQAHAIETTYHPCVATPLQL